MVDNVYGAGSGAIFMDDVDCTGSETSLADCSHRGWGSHHCGQSEDVAIECYVPTTATVGMNIVVYNVQITRAVKNHVKIGKITMHFAGFTKTRLAAGLRPNPLRELTALPQTR